MKKLLIAVSSLTALTMLGGAICYVLILSNKELSWFRPIDITVDSGAILTIPTAATTQWGFGDWENMPALQHTPYIFNATYDDARFVDVRGETITIHGANQIVHQKTHGKGTRFPSIRFTPDLRRFFYITTRWAEPGTLHHKQSVVTDKWSSKEYDAVSLPSFSADGKHVAFIGMTRFDSIIAGVPTTISMDVVLDNKVIASYPDLTATSMDLNERMLLTSFNPVTNELAYVVNNYGSPFDRFKGESFVVFGNKKSKIYPEIDGVPVFSPDGKHTAFIARKAPQNLVAAPGPRNEATVVCDGHETQTDMYSAQNLMFSPDSTRCIFTANVGSSETLVVSGQNVASGVRGYIRNLIINSRNTIAYTVTDGGNMYIRAGDVVYGTYAPSNGDLLLTSEAEMPVFERLVQTGEEPVGMGGVPDGVDVPMEPTFDSTLQVGSESGTTLYDDIEDIVYANDVRKIVVYTALKGLVQDSDHEEFVIVGTTEIGPYNDVWEPYVVGDTIVFGARKGRSLYRVVVTIKEQ